MLQKGFLQRIADWVHAEFDAHPADLERAMHAFGLHALITNGADPDQLTGLFSEWLLYDVTSPLFKNMTGLAYFVQYNPLSLTNTLLQSYRDLLAFKVGYFEVVAVFPGERVMLEDMQRVTYDVFDINASLSAQVKTTMWSRLARVDGVYQMVGSSGFVLPLTMGNHAKKYGVADEHIDAKVAATFMYASQDISAEQKTRNTITTTIPTVADVERAAKKFDDALASAGMSEMLSSVTLKKWVNNDKRFPLDFPIKALFFLSPDDITERNRDKILDTAYEYLAVCPRKAFGGKSSTEQAKIVQNKSP